MNQTRHFRDGRVKSACPPNQTCVTWSALAWRHIEAQRCGAFASGTGDLCVVCRDLIAIRNSICQRPSAPSIPVIAAANNSRTNTPPIISNTIIVQSFNESFGGNPRRWFGMAEEVVRLRRPKQEASAGPRSLGRYCFALSSSHRLRLWHGGS